MGDAARQSLGQVFSRLRSSGRLGLLPFIPAGYPDLATTRALIPALERAGADAVEIGFPFSDPIADGPIIQAAFTEALGKGLKVGQVFDAVAAVRGSVSIPLIAMVSHSIVFRQGVEGFCGRARSAGFDGLIIPDLPPPEAEKTCRQVRSAGLDTILLVAPTTPPERRAEIARLSSGFVYYLSVTGITGERKSLPGDLERNVRELRALSQVPVCVGFGISRPDHVASLKGVADGAIIGSAIVRRLADVKSAGPEAMAAAAGAFCEELARAC